MRRTRLLSTAAVALTFGLGAALNAASAQTKPNPEPAPSAQQNAPPAKIAPPLNADDQKSRIKSETTGQSPKSGVEPRSGASAGQDMSKDNPASATAKPERSTTGQGAAAGASKLSAEQRSKITTAFKQQKVRPVEASKLNISISVGARVPSTVTYYPVPQEVVVIYPEWRGYDYILVGNRILIIEPGTHEIVAILDA